MRFIIIILLITVYTSCQKEQPTLPSNDICNLTICFDTYSTTKSGLIPESIANLNVLVFDNNDNLIKQVYLNNQVSTTIRIGYGLKTVVAIANVGNYGFSQSLTLSQLRETKYSSITGTAGNVVFCGEISHNFSESNKTIIIPMCRMVSKITYVFDKSALNPNVNISISKIQLMNTPTECCFISSNTPNYSQIESEGDALDTYNLEPANHECATPLYMFENIQGTIGSNNNSITKHPGWKENVCTYVEITASYNSPTKEGTIKYKNFLGLNSTNNYDIIRGKHYQETIVFNGTSINEVSWRVDVSDLHDIQSNIAVTGISLDCSHLKLISGSEHQLHANIFPANATNRECNWSSSNPSVVSVNPATGKLIAHSYGESTVTVNSCDGNFYSQCLVNVYDHIKLIVDTYELNEYNLLTQEMISCAVTPYLRVDLERPSNMNIVQAIYPYVTVNITYSYLDNGVTNYGNCALKLDNIYNNDYPYNGIGGSSKTIYFTYPSTEQQIQASLESISINITPGNVYVQNWYVTW